MVSGADDGRLLAEIPARGVVKICARGGCGDTVYPLAQAGQQLGPAVLTDGLLIVPDHSAGSAEVLSSATGQRLAAPSLLTGPAGFDLFTQDTVVFYNDPASNRAGVLHQDGTFTAIEKYAADHPGQALDVAASARTVPTSPQPDRGSSASTPGRVTSTPPTSAKTTTPTAGPVSTRLTPPVTVASSVCSDVCSYSYLYGTTVRLQASPGSGYNFTNFSFNPSSCGTGCVSFSVTNDFSQESADFDAQDGFGPGNGQTIATNFFGKTEMCVTNLDNTRVAVFKASSGPTTIGDTMVGPGGTNCSTLNRAWVAIPLTVVNDSTTGAHVSVSTQ